MYQILIYAPFVAVFQLLNGSSDIIYLSDIPELIAAEKRITTEILALAKKRHYQIIGKKE